MIFSDGRDPLNLSHHDPALRLLQHIRDEAHHFANSFNAELRSQRLRESILEDFKLQHFGSLDKLRKADAAAICEVDGIGPKTAHRVSEESPGKE